MSRLVSYRQLTVWKKAVDLTVEIYRITKKFPRSELYGLTSQIRRAAAAIPANIAEGYGRGYRREYVQFLRIAFSSGTELETHILIANRVRYLSKEEYKKISDQLVEVMKMLNVLTKRLSLKS
jgi:four helix bundle protein